MKIAVLSAANSIHTVKIINSLAALGHAVRLYTMPQHRDTDHAISPDVKVVHLDSDNYFKNHKQMRRELKEFGADVVYAHYATGYGTVARKTGFHPTVLAVWGSDVYDFPRQGIVNNLFLRYNLLFPDRIFSTSYAMAEHTKAYTKKEIVITPFGVDLDVFSPKSKEEPERDAVIRIGFLKSASPIYGIQDLVRAFGMLVARCPDISLELAVYGDGEQLEEMKQLTRDLGIQDQTVFYGRIPHSRAPEVLREMDILCVPSLRESFGVTAVEGMACGVPCVVTQADGLQEVTKNEETGLTVPCGQPEALCDALQKLVLHPELREKMGKAGRARAAELYDWEQNIKTIENGLREVVEHKHKKKGQ